MEKVKDRMQVNSLKGLNSEPWQNLSKFPILNERSRFASG